MLLRVARELEEDGAEDGVQTTVGSVFIIQPRL